MDKLPNWMMTWFNRSYEAYLNANQSYLEGIQSVAHNFVSYDDLPNSEALPKVAQVKLNGGLGTSMGCSGPKSLVQCDVDGRCFMDVIVNMHQKSEVASKLIFLNSFNTSVPTVTFLDKNYPDLDYLEVLQHAFPKINQKTNQPFTSEDPFFYNPPGHGSVYFDLYHSGVLKQLLTEGIDYLFISNADNIAAYCDLKIASHLKQSNTPFLIELTPKRASDVKGGTIVSSNGRCLWETAQVSDSQQALFQEQPVFNTNNIWVHIPSLIQVIESNSLLLDLILNKKSKNGFDFVQLEYAMGSAIQSFDNACAMIVPRSRFFPVKKTNDLLLLLSDVVSFNDDGQLSWDTGKTFDIQCHAPFDSVEGFFNYLKVVPSLKSSDSLSLQGNICFNHHLELKGTVKFSMANNENVEIPSSEKVIENAHFNNGKITPI